MADDLDKERTGATDAGRTEFKCFIGGLSYEIDSDGLRKAFDRYDCATAEVMIDKHTNRPRGFGFVYFRDEAGMKDAIANMHDQELFGRKISVVKAVPQDQTKPGTPAAALGGGSGARRDYYPRDRGAAGGGGYGGRYDPRDRGYDRGGYDRGGYGGYERGGYDRGYDPRGGYGSYDRAGYGGYGAAAAAPAPASGYAERGADPYRDAYRGYGGGGYAGGSYAGGGYGAGYDDRAGYGSGAAYDYGRSAYDDRGAGGPDRRGYGSSAAPRGGPYERAPERRAPEPAPRR